MNNKNCPQYKEYLPILINLSVFLLLLFSFFFISNNPIISAENDSGDEELFQIDENGDPLVGIDFLTTSHDAPEDYEHISQVYEDSQESYSNLAEEQTQILENTKEYALSSIDQMLTDASSLQTLLQDFYWMDADDNLRLLTYINEELLYLTEQKVNIENLKSAEEIKSIFLEVFTDWQSFRMDLKIMSSQIFTKNVSHYCGLVINEDNADVFNSETEIRLYSQFNSDCEDWGKDEDVNLSNSLLTLIKVVE